MLNSSITTLDPESNRLQAVVTRILMPFRARRLRVPIVWLKYSRFATDDVLIIIENITTDMDDNILGSDGNEIASGAVILVVSAVIP